MNRECCEQEIVKILEGYQNNTLSPSDYYKVKTVELISSIDNEEYLKKIYSFALVFR